MKILGGATSARRRHFTLLVCHVRLSTASVSHSSTVMYSCNALFSILITTLFSFIHLDFHPRLCLYHNILCSCSLKLLYHGLTAGASASCSKSLSIFHSSFQYSALLYIVSCPVHYHSENIIGQHLRFWHWLSLKNEALMQFDFVVGKYCQLREPVAKQVCG